MIAAILAVALAFTSQAVRPYWPPSLAEVEYDHRIEVINTLGGSETYRQHIRAALQEWNACGADIRLVVDNDATPYREGTITITRSDDGGAYGGWTGIAGVVYLGDGWTRTREVIAHEVGHALGFTHAGTNGAHSIMYDAAHVTPTDCEGLRQYY